MDYRQLVFLPRCQITRRVERVLYRMSSIWLVIAGFLSTPYGDKRQWREGTRIRYPVRWQASVELLLFSNFSSRENGGAGLAVRDK